ncbi:MAG: helix-turn-helix domain-containing protein [Candidatus Omnitrophica bacterium]|nr:helix-turn-helix domain-containing protein [Candidatus Omnitrophota bacterium]
MAHEAEWLTVKEAADKAGITTQAIYKKLKHNGLQTKKEDGRIYVLWEDIQTWAQPVANNDTTEIIEVLKNQLESNQQTINLLQTQLQEKDAQINQLHVILAQSQDIMKRTQLALESAENRLKTPWWTRFLRRRKLC